MYFDKPDEERTGSKHVAAVQRRVYLYGKIVVLGCIVYRAETVRFTGCIVYRAETVRFTGWLSLFGL
jgi:hypothetical protein